MAKDKNVFIFAWQVSSLMAVFIRLQSQNFPPLFSSVWKHSVCQFAVKESVSFPFSLCFGEPVGSETSGKSDCLMNQGEGQAVPTATDVPKGQKASEYGRINSEGE